MSPIVEIRVWDYCTTKQTDLWACHKMSEDELLMLQDNKFAIGEIYRKLKNDIEAMKEQNEIEALELAKTKKYWKEMGKDFNLHHGL
jgi:hypothetical protein